MKAVFYTTDFTSTVFGAPWIRLEVVQSRHLQSGVGHQSVSDLHATILNATILNATILNATILNATILNATAPRKV